MKRPLAVFFWILVGAMASGGSISYFLRQANLDRERLAEETRSAKDSLEQTKIANEKLAEEANRKLADASQEIAKAQQMVRKLEEERRLRSEAVPLPQPDARMQKTWFDAIHLPLGLSLRLPAGMQATSTEKALLAYQRSRLSNAAMEQWLSVTAYDGIYETELLQSLKNEKTVAYQVQNHLLTGVRGTLSDLPGHVYVLRVGNVSTSTHLIWARADAAVADERVLHILATLSLRS